jgi:hypothetical protein
MPESNGGDNGMRPDIDAQVNYIRHQFAAKSNTKESPVAVVTEGVGLGYMFHAGRILVREEYLTRVLETLGQEPSGDRVQPVIRGVVLLTLLQSDDGTPTVTSVLDLIDDRFGAGVATPDHLLTTAPDGSPCPATEPEEAYDHTEPYPGVCRSNSGAGVLVYISDTGLLADAAATHPWLRGVDGDPDPLPAPGVDGTQAIPPYTGHGTFVAGVVRCMAPEAEVFVANELADAGSAWESDLVPRLNAALARPVDIFHLSIASPTRNNQPLIGIEAWLGLLQQYKGTVCVVTAGNDGSRHRCWPGASAGTVSVGALAADWRSRARFSNHGSWVDVYAPGRDLVNAFATGTYTCYVPPYKSDERKFYGMAKWSGTSFSAPVVTGLIAARMSRTGENARQAAEALLAEARHRAIPGVGPVLLPCCEPPCRGDCGDQGGRGDCASRRPGMTTCGCRLPGRPGPVVAAAGAVLPWVSTTSRTASTGRFLSGACG